MATSPLTYESHSTHPQSQSVLSLPSYTSRATSQHTLHGREHQYTLGSSTGRPWLILSIQSRSPDPNLLPLYYEGDTISGAVSVDLKSGEHIREVLVSLQGQILGAGQDLEPYTFLDITQAIWSQPAGKLNGRHSWSFAITPPREVTVPSPTTPFLPTTYQLPPKFSERGSQAHVDYKILVTVRRRRLSVDSTLFTPCVYLPYSVAIPPSPRRLAAYRNEMLPPGPDADPEGWKILPVVEERVAISGAQRASIQCSLAIAAPVRLGPNTTSPELKIGQLSFAVNSYVPLYAVLRSRHENLVQRAAISVQLVRTLHVADFTATRRGMSFYDVMSEAVFWPASDEHSQMPGTKALRGELPLRKKLTPSFHFSKVSIQYAVVLSAVRSPGFTPAPRDIPLLSEPVQVMLKNPHGVSPRSFAPSNAQMATGASSSYDHHTQQRLERATYVGYPYVGQAA